MRCWFKQTYSSRSITSSERWSGSLVRECTKCWLNTTEVLEEDTYAQDWVKEKRHQRSPSWARSRWTFSILSQGNWIFSILSQDRFMKGKLYQPASDESACFLPLLIVPWPNGLSIHWESPSFILMIGDGCQCMGELHLALAICLLVDPVDLMPLQSEGFLCTQALRFGQQW